MAFSMACKLVISAITVFCFLLPIELVFTQQISAVESTQADCNSRWIHIRSLPSRFNLDLLADCSQYPLFDDLCPYLANHGLGPKTHNRSHSWYRTEPSLLELVFHRRILEYPCLTPDPNLANAIYLPYYAALDSLRYLYGPDVNSSMEHGMELFRFLSLDSPEVWSRHMGHDHFLLMARPAWDFSQPLTNDPPVWGTSFLELPEFFNVTALVLESRPWPWQEQAVPYPTSYHPSNLRFLESWVQRVKRARRTTFMLFAGGGGVSATPNIRRSIRNECLNSSDTSVSDGGYAKVCEIVDCSDTSVSDGGYAKVCEIVDCSNSMCEHDPIRYMKPMLQATFCLQPPGDTPTRRSTFDGILAGCIPVFFEDQSAKSQYQWHLPEDEYDQFSVSIPKEDVVFKGLKIFDELLAIPKSEVRRMRERVIELIPRLIYRRHGSSMGLRSKKDAFDVAIEGILQRIKSRLEGHSVQ